MTRAIEVGMPQLRTQNASPFHRSDILVVVGGVVPTAYVPKLIDMGAAHVFGPGTVITGAKP